MINLTDKASGFSHKAIQDLAAALRRVYEQESPPANKIEVLVPELAYAEKAKMVYASVELTVGGKKHISKSKFRMFAPGIINMRTFTYL